MKLLKTFLLAAVLAASAVPALALPITITGLDNFGNSATATAPSPVTFGPTTVGTWTVQGQALGTPPAPLGTLLSNTISFNTGAAGTLTVWVTETGITGLQGLRDFHSSLTSNGFFGPLTATLSTYLQVNNTVPGPIVGTGVLLDSFLFNNIGTQVADINELIGVNPFSLTEKYVIVATGAGGANLTAQVNAVAVPEPSTVAVFGLGMLGMLWFASRRKRPRVSA
jgi:hypothetical protein